MQLHNKLVNVIKKIPLQRFEVSNQHLAVLNTLTKNLSKPTTRDERRRWFSDLIQLPNFYQNATNTVNKFCLGVEMFSNVYLFHL